MAKISAIWRKAQRFFPLIFKTASPRWVLNIGERVDLPPGYFPTNPSILSIGNGFLICVRGVNYTLKDARSMKPRLTGEQCVRTINKFLVTSQDFSTFQAQPQLDAAFSDIEYVKLFASLLNRGPTSAWLADQVALHGLAIDCSGIAGTVYSEGYGVAAQARGGDVRRSKRAAERLKTLRQFELLITELPNTLDLCRHDPQERRAPVGAIAADDRGLVGPPIPHRKCIRHDSGAGPEIENLRTKPLVDRRKQKHGDDRRVGKVALEQIGFRERGAVGHASLSRISLGQRTMSGLYSIP